MNWRFGLDSDQKIPGPPDDDPQSTIRKLAARQKALFGIFERREGWKLSLKGIVFVVVAALGIAGAVLHSLYSFLAHSDRVVTNVLVIDGAMPIQILAQAADEYVRGGYR